MSIVALRSLAVEDVSWIFDACQDGEIQRWTLVPRPYTREHAERFVDGGNGEFARWVIESTADGRPVGVISIHAVEDSAASIGYWIASQDRGQGFTTAAIGLVCDEIERLRSAPGIDVRFVRAFIARDNRASRRAVEGAGFGMVEERHGPAVEGLVQVPTCTYMKRL